MKIPKRKSSSSDDSKDTIEQVPICTYDVAHIPGFSTLWENEIKKRIAAIHAHANRSFSKTIFDLVKRTQTSSDVTGEELSKINPSSLVNGYVSQLQKNPLDIESRIQLITAVMKGGNGQKKKDAFYSPELCRKLLLQANVACALDGMNESYLRVAIYTQNLYLERLLSRCKYELEKINHQMNERTRTPNIHRKTLHHKNKIVLVHRMLENFMSYQKPFLSKQQNANTRHTRPSTLISKSELLHLFFDQNESSRFLKKSQEVRMKINLIIEEISPMIQLIRYLPLLHSHAEELIDLLIRITPTHPLPYFFRARIKMSELTFLKHQLEIKGSTEVLLQKIKKTYQIVYRNYFLAVKKIGTPKSDVDFIIFLEFANSTLFFYILTKNIRQKSQSLKQMHTHIRHAITAITEVYNSRNIQTSNQAKKIQKHLLQIQEELEALH